MTSDLIAKRRNRVSEAPARVRGEVCSASKIKVDLPVQQALANPNKVRPAIATVLQDAEPFFPAVLDKLVDLLLINTPISVMQQIGDAAPSSTGYISLNRFVCAILF
jgi:hypothetical protein